MNENELRHALHATMTVATPPEPMNESPMLDLAKRTHRRRRATWAGAGSAAAVMAVVAGAMVLAPTADDGSPGLTVGDAGVTSKGTEPQWPDGQTDATATAGSKYDQGVALMNELIGSAPDGFETPDDLVYADPAYEDSALRVHQAADHGANGKWEYYAIVPVAADGGLGKIFVQVNAVGNDLPGEGCELSRTLWSQVGGTCEEITVAGTTLGVVTDTGPQSAFDQWVAFRTPDGAVVYTAQDNEFEGSGQPPLSDLPFTAQQLAELAADARFHLS